MSHIDLNRLVEALEPDLRVSLETAASVAVRRSHQFVDIAHWLSAVVDNDAFADAFERLKISKDDLRAQINRALDDAAVGDGEALSLSQNTLMMSPVEK